MTLRFNGDEIEQVFFNGDDLEEVYFNGDLVFDKADPTWYAFTDPSQAFATTTDNFRIGIRADANEAGAYNKIYFYARDLNTGSGGWATNPVTIGKDGNSWAGTSSVVVNGREYGISSPDGVTLRPIASSIATSGVTISAGIVAGDAVAYDPNSNSLRVNNFAGDLRIIFRSGIGGYTATLPAKDISQVTL